MFIRARPYAIIKIVIILFSLRLILAAKAFLFSKEEPGVVVSLKQSKTKKRAKLPAFLHHPTISAQNLAVFALASCFGLDVYKRQNLSHANRRDNGVVAEFLPAVNVGHVYLNTGQPYRRDGVPQGIAVMGQSPCVNNHCAGCLPGFVELVDQHPLVVGLKNFTFIPFLLRCPADFLIDGFSRFGAVNALFPQAGQIQVRPQQDQKDVYKRQLLCAPCRKR